MGVCFDTCHVHDSGYDIVNDLDGVIDEFDKTIGLDRLKVLHINGSLNPRERGRTGTPTSARTGQIQRERTTSVLRPYTGSYTIRDYRDIHSYLRLHG